MQALVLFVISTGDVPDERLAVCRVVEKWQVRYRETVRLELLTRESPAVADGRIGPADCDVLIGILGSTLDPDADAGIERDLEAVTRSGEENQGPSLFFFRRADPSGSRDTGKELDAFCRRLSSNKSGAALEFRPFGSADDFAARVEADLGELLVRRFGEMEAQPLAEPPYLGTAVFDHDDAGRFFGRDRPLAEVLEQLKRNHAAGHPFLLVHGEPAAGKSSMIRAGLVPRLTADGRVPEVGAWCGTTLEPLLEGSLPMESLVRAIHDALPDLARIRDTSRPAPTRKKARKAAQPRWDQARLARALADPAKLVFAVTAITAALDRVSVGKPAQLLILADPLDRLFTDERVTAETRERFFRALAALVRSRRVWVVATLRGGLFPRLGEHRDLSQLVRDDGGYLLGPPDESELRSIIRLPALAAGLRFETDPESGLDLSEVILRDASKVGGDLRLLAPVLEKLYQLREGGLLTFAGYRGAGGFAGRSAADHEKPRARRGRKLHATGLALAGLAAGVLGTLLWERQAEPVLLDGRAAGSVSDARGSLAAADFDAGVSRIAAGSPDEALPYLISALAQVPDHLDAQALLLATLRTTRWHFPVAELSHPLPVTRLEFGADGRTLFASVDGGGGGFNTTLRWHLPDASIQALLKPEMDGQTHVLDVAPGGKRLVVRRGDVALLCDAESMEPVRILPLASNSEAGAIAWSAEGALLAYPVKDGDDHAWVIADAATGGTIRQSDIFAAGDPLSCQLDRERLRAIHSDGTLVELPLAPDQPPRRSIGESRISQAVLSPDGSELLARYPGQDSQLFSLRDEQDGIGLGRLENWHPSRWLVARSGDVMLRADLLEPDRHPVPPPVAVDGAMLVPAHAAPLRVGSPVVAAALGGSRVAAGTAAGRVVVHQFVPALGYAARNASKPAAAGDAFDLAAGWNSRLDAAISPDRTRVVKGDQGNGIVIADPVNGRILCDPEMIDGVRRVVFVGDEKVTIAGSRGVLVFGTAGDRFTKVAEIPVPDALDLHPLARSGDLAVATAGQVVLIDGDDFQSIAALPFSGASAGAWAGDRDTGWLAFAGGEKLTVWSTKARRVLLQTRVTGSDAIGFIDRDGMRGVQGEFGFVPLARTTGVDAGTLNQLRKLCLGLGGMEIGDRGGPLVQLSRSERLELLDGDLAGLSGLLAGADLPALGAFLLAMPHATSDAAAWLPVWERLAMVPGVDEPRLIRWSSSLGDHPWFRHYLRGRIARADVDLKRAWEGETLEHGETGWMHRLAGDADEIRELKQASWRAAGGEAAGREEALALLDARVGSTRATFDADPTSANALAHAEALAWRGEAAKAAEFLAGKLSGGAALTLEQAHFLISFGLSDAAKDAVSRALDEHASPWLWRQWLQAGDAGEPLAAMVERTMNAVGGRGPAAVEALWIALAERDAAAIGACLKSAKDLPEPLARYAAGAALWAQDKQAEAFAMWPDGFPDLADEAAAGDWRGWEGALPASDGEDLFAAMGKELATLTEGPEASVEDWKSLAARLLDPETTAKFGALRVRSALISCALVLAGDAGSSKLVAEMVDRARLAGASPVDCLRIEARSAMAAESFTLAYSRWLQLLESEEGVIVPADYLDAARCVMADLQDAAAIELLMQGKRRFPDDASFAHDAAWILLTGGHPEEAGILLEHGFGIPFTGEEREIAAAMLVCAAEQTLRTARADEAFRELVALEPTWGEEASLAALEWPEELRQVLLTVAARNP